MLTQQFTRVNSMLGCRSVRSPSLQSIVHAQTTLYLTKSNRLPEREAQPSLQARRSSLPSGSRQDSSISSHPEPFQLVHCVLASMPGGLRGVLTTNCEGGWMVASVAKVFGSVDDELLRPRATANFRMMKLVPGAIVNVSGRCHAEFPGSSN